MNVIRYLLESEYRRKNAENYTKEMIRRHNEIEGWSEKAHFKFEDKERHSK